MDFLKIIWRKWLVVARIIGNFQAQVILTLFYFAILFPVGFLFKIFSDPLRLSRRQDFPQKTSFQKWVHLKEDLDQSRKQY